MKYRIMCEIYDSGSIVMFSALVNGNGGETSLAIEWTLAQPLRDELRHGRMPVIDTDEWPSSEWMAQDTRKDT